MGETTLILGAGIGGLATAHQLRRRLPATHRIVVAERAPHHLYSPSLLWVATGARTAEEIVRPLENLERKGIEVARGEVESIDPAGRRAVVGGREFAADRLVIALGADLAPEAIPGLTEAGHNFYTPAGAEALRDAFTAFNGGRIVVLTAGQPYKCPAAPYEMAMLLERGCRRRGIRDRTRIDLHAAEPAPMPVAGPVMGDAVCRMLAARDIGYHPQHQVTAVDPAAGRLTFADDTSAEFDLLAYVPPHRAPAVVRAAGLAPDGGYVPTDRATLETAYEGVYALGDVTAIPLSIGKPLPKAGVFANSQGRVVADNIVRAVTGRGRPARFDGHGACFLEIGGAVAGLGRGNFYAEPAPAVKLHMPGPHWHFARVLLEWQWLRMWS